ncbi:MAG: phosphoribosylformylglycinamidine synthase subunit PurL [Acidimicrobiia bacterium]|nr:phosphoribosylformylglycinamidine synthase subunit PurL [Acidimicrobiia bacterium]
MNYCVEVVSKPGFRDIRAENLEGQVRLLGVPGVDSVEIGDRYYLAGDLSPALVQQLADDILCDVIIEDARWFPISADHIEIGDGVFTVDVVLHPGVTDTPAESLLAGIAELGIEGVVQAATGTRYTLRGSELTQESVEHIAASLLANDVIQTYHINDPAPPPFTADASGADPVAHIPLAGLSEQQLVELSGERRLSLDGTEMRAIQAYFGDRPATDLELETLAQTWSEHCVHKTFRAAITYTGPPPGELRPITTTTIDGILAEHIRAATETIDKPWVRSAFVDDAGIVALDDTTDLAFKVETHNHPSALEPFGGANTGVGGVVRDVIGVSARPIANTDILFFGPEDTDPTALPEGVLHPRRIAAGVISGIEDYGNKMGIPTVAGAIYYDPGYTANPLVFCGCLGALPTGTHPTAAQPGDRIVVLGGRTGRDGLRGATFSSMESDHTTSELSGSAVQIGHPIHEKQTLEVIMQARDEGLYNAITDCGAGGLSSSVGEMAEELGAVVHLERVPLKYPGLASWEIWLSEAQERMVIAVPNDNVPRVTEIAESLDVEITVLGEFTGDGVLRILHDDETVGELECGFLHGGIPRQHLTAEWAPSPTEARALPEVEPVAALLALLADPNIRSKEATVRRYDHEVQGGTVLKPFIGPHESGPADAAVVTPLKIGPGTPGAALAVGTNPAYGAIDPYRMAWANIDEAVRNVVAVGADPDRISILDNFSWGNPRIPDRLGALVRCTQGCHDAAITYGTPFISGKDSLNNEYTGSDGKKHTIPGTLVISSLGIVPDVGRTVTSDLKEPGNVLFVVGTTGRHLGGSALAAWVGQTGGEAPAPVPTAPAGYRALHRTIAAGLVRACHDVSEGGIAVAVAEMAIGGEIGVTVDLRFPAADEPIDDTTAAFSESLGRLVAEVRPEDAAEFERIMGVYPVSRIGKTVASQEITMRGTSSDFSLSLATATEAWRGGTA